MNFVSRLLLILFLASLESMSMVQAQQPITNSADDSQAPLPPLNNSAVTTSQFPLASPTNAAPAATSGEATGSPAPAGAESVAQKLQDASRLSDKKQFGAALEKLDSVLLSDPKSLSAYSLRGYIYSQQKEWDKSRKDFEMILQLDPSAITAKFDLSELKFMQASYDDARVGFVALEKDPQVDDLAAYKVFLCDMLAGHTHVANDELNAFDDVGIHPSYYFSNIAWAIYNKKPEDARDWLASALRIYAPYKIQLYAATLEELGYLPLPPPPNADTSTSIAPDSNAAPLTNSVLDTNTAPALAPSPGPTPTPAPAPTGTPPAAP